MTTERDWPEWLVVRVPAEGPAPAVDGMLRDLGLHTVCEEAQCPNIWDCYHRRTATFLVLGDTCTRNCRFCAVKHGCPQPPDLEEPARLAEAVRRLGLGHVVITSVTRDDLTDGGASHFASCVKAVKEVRPETAVEVLVPDFQGSAEAVGIATASRPKVFGHNVETVPRLYASARPGAGYRRSLDVLRLAAEAGQVTKSGLMLGLGETREEVEAVLADLREAGCSLLSLGQYLRPSEEHLPVARFIPPGEFESLRETALSMGFSGVAAGPLARSSYHAAELLAGTGRAAAVDATR